jgi:hypothetical protein
MSEDDWIKPRIARARAGLPLVTQPVVERIEELLTGQLSEHELAKGDRTSIARQLIAEMAGIPPKAEANQ